MRYHSWNFDNDEGANFVFALSLDLQPKHVVPICPPSFLLGNCGVCDESIDALVRDNPTRLPKYLDSSPHEIRRVIKIIHVLHKALSCFSFTKKMKRIPIDQLKFFFFL